MRKNIKKWLIQAMPWILGIALIGVILYLGDVSKLENLLKADPIWLVIALLCTWFHIQLSGLRWESILKFIHPYRDYPAGFFSRAVLLGLISGLLVTQEIGLAATRLTMLKTSTPVPAEKAVYSTTLDRLLDFALMALLGITSLPFVLGYWNAYVTFLTMAGMIILFVLSAYLPDAYNPVNIVSRLYAWLAGLVTRIPFISRRMSSQWISMNDYSLDKRIIIQINLFTCLRYFVLVARYSCVALAFGLNASFFIFWISTPLTLLTLLIGFFPGGLGVADLSMYALLISSNSMGADAATLFVIGNRMFTIISLLFLFVLDQMLKHIKKIPFPGRL